MGLLEDITLKIKRRETPVYEMMYRAAKGMTSLNLPNNGPVRAVARTAYATTIAAREVGDRVRSSLWAVPLFRARCAQSGDNLYVEKVPYITGHAKIIVGDNVTISGRITIHSGRFLDEPELIIGNNVCIGHNVIFTVNRRVVLEDHVSIADAVGIADSDGHPLDWERRAAHDDLRDEEMQEVVIGEHAWIGRCAQILKGVKVGPRSICGAGSVVVSEVPPDSVAVGSPARMISLKRD